MNHKRVRTDTFDSNGSFLRVTGRQGYESSTDIWATRDIEVEFEQKVVDTEEEGWNVLRNDSAYSIPHTYDIPNLNGNVDLDLATGGINNSLENVTIRPVGCRNSYNAYPKTQLKLLRYLIPYRKLVRQNPFEVTSHEVTFDVNSENSHVGGSMPEQHWWDPTVNGDLVVGVHANAAIAGNANSVEEIGFCPRDLIQFGYFNAPPAGNPNAVFVPFIGDHRIPIRYDPTLDSLFFNDYDEHFVVRMQTEVLGGAPNNNAHYFELDPGALGGLFVNDAWRMTFDENGIAGRVAQHDLPAAVEPPFVANANVVPGPGDAQFDAEDWALYLLEVEAREEYDTEHDEFLAEQAVIDAAEVWFGLKNSAAHPQNNMKYTYAAGTLNEFYTLFMWSNAQPGKFVLGSVPIPNIGGAAPYIRLFLRRPRFSKGNEHNWAANPATNRLFSWYDKEVTLLGYPEFVHFDDPTPFADLARRNAPKRPQKLGDWSVVWAGRTFAFGNNTERYITRYVISIDDVALWNRIRFKGAAVETTLLLETGPVLTKNPLNDHIDPPVYLNSTRFYLRFQTQHAQFNQFGGENLITFDFAFIEALGGGGFGLGVPQTLGDGERVYPNGPFTGWVEDDEPGQPMIAELTAEGTAPGLFGNAVTERGYEFATGRRPLVGGAWADSFDLHTKADFAAHDVIVDGVDLLWQGLDDMFKGKVYVNVPELTDYRSVRVGRSKNSIQLKEPFFGLDSGMSTYKVQHIFKPKPWYSILLQDFDYQFEPTRSSNTHLQRDSEIEFVLETIRDSVENGVFVADTEVDVNLEDVTLNIKDATKTTLTVRSRDGLDQRTKLLENITESYPLFKQYTAEVEGGENPTTTVSIYSERGVPSYFFIYAERNLSADVGFVPDYNPLIVGLEVYGRTNKHKPLSSYLADKHEIWQATLRNAHPMADDVPLLEVGGVLISKADLGTLERDEFSTLDNFDYDLKIFIENEDQGDDESNAQFAARNLNSITVRVFCIFMDQLFLKGTSQNLTFVEGKPTN